MGNVVCYKQYTLICISFFHNKVIFPYDDLSNEDDVKPQQTIAITKSCEEENKNNF